MFRINFQQLSKRFLNQVRIFKEVSLEKMFFPILEKKMKLNNLQNLNLGKAKTKDFQQVTETGFQILISTKTTVSKYIRHFLEKKNNFMEFKGIF